MLTRFQLSHKLNSTPFSYYVLSWHWNIKLRSALGLFLWYGSVTFFSEVTANLDGGAEFLSSIKKKKTGLFIKKRNLEIHEVVLNSPSKSTVLWNVKKNYPALSWRVQDFFSALSRRVQDIISTLSRRVRDFFSALSQRVQDIISTMSRRVRDFFSALSRRVFAWRTEKSPKYSVAILWARFCSVFFWLFRLFFFCAFCFSVPKPFSETCRTVHTVEDEPCDS